MRTLLFALLLAPSAVAVAQTDSSPPAQPSSQTEAPLIPVQSASAGPGELRKYPPCTKSLRDECINPAQDATAPREHRHRHRPSRKR